MKTIWRALMRLLHPITLAVVLIGVGGFLLGLIVAVERQDAAVVTLAEVTPKVDAAAAERVAGLEATLAERETALAARQSELADLQSEVARLRAEAPAAAEINGAESRVAGLEAALADSSTELNTLRGEVTKLAGQLAETIQSRDELRVLSERARRDNDNERASFEQAIAAMRGQLEAAEQRAAEQRAAAPAPVVAAPVAAEASQPAETATEPETKTATATPEPPSASGEVSPPAEPESRLGETEAAADEQSTETLPPPPAETSKPEEQTAAAPAPAVSAPAATGPISQGIEAYRAEDYRKAYEIWLPQALKGSSRAQFYVGALYFEGRGVPTDLVRSYMWLRAATNKKDSGAVKLLNRVRENMNGPELAEAESRIANGETIPDR